MSKSNFEKTVNSNVGNFGFYFRLFVLVFVFFSLIISQKIFAQQGYNRITVDTADNKMTLETRDLANGVNDINTINGPKNFNSFSNNGGISVYNQNSNIRYEPGNRLGGNTSVINPNETIGSGTASYNSSTQNSAPFFKNTANPSDTLLISATRNAPNGSTNGPAGLNPTNILKFKAIVNDINSLPDNTRIFIDSRPGNLNPGGSRNGIIDGIKKVNGVWTEPTTDPRGGALNNQGSPLDNNSFDNPLSKTALSPNPAQDVFRIDDGFAIESQFDVKVYSADGKEVLSLTNVAENISIEVSSLKCGIYFVSITNSFSGEKFINKLVKQ